MLPQVSANGLCYRAGFCFSGTVYCVLDRMPRWNRKEFLADIYISMFKKKIGINNEVDPEFQVIESHFGIVYFKVLPH